MAAGPRKDRKARDSQTGGESFSRLADLLGDAYSNVCSGEALPGADEVAPAAPKALRAPRGAPSVAGGQRANPAADQATDLARRLSAVWDEVVGAEVAANSRPLRLKQGRLTASASSAAWAQTLQFLSGSIVVRLNERLGEHVVNELVFHHAGWEEGVRKGPARSFAGLDGEAQAGQRGATVPASPPDAPLQASSPGAVHREPTLSSEQRRALESVEDLALEPELKRRIANAMRAAFVRAQQGSVR